MAFKDLYLAAEGEISVVDEFRRSPASLPWCAVRPVADDCLEEEGTTKEAGATKGVLAEIQARWVSVNSSAANWFEYENSLRRIGTGRFFAKTTRQL